MSPSGFVFLIGAPKCGTSSLAAWLGGRDDAVVGFHKEPLYFTDFARRPWSGPASNGLKRTVITNEGDYLANFAAKPEAAWAIDATTDYLWSDGTAERIKRFSESVPSKIICIIRDPIERAISEYNHTRRHDWETETFGRSLELEDARRRKHWHPLFYHRRRSTVQADLRRYHELFGPTMLILDFAELKEPDRLMERVALFLGIRPLPVARNTRENVSLLPRNRLAKALGSSDLLRRVGRAVFPPEHRQKVRDLLRKPSFELTTTSRIEEQRLRELLKDEIAACVLDPIVPTANWTKALEA